MTVRIVTDSSCDLRGDEVADPNIEVVPLSIRFGDDEYTDREQLSVDRFYELLATSDTLPETAAPSPGRFAESFQRHLDAGATAIVCINISATRIIWFSTIPILISKRCSIYPFPTISRF